MTIAVIRAGAALAGPVPAFQRSLLPDRLRAPDVHAIADVTGDGRLDLVTGADTGIFVLPGDGSGKFTSWYRAADDVFYAEALVVADFDQDGRLDLAGSGYIGSPGAISHIVRVWLGEEGGRFRRAFDFGPNYSGGAAVAAGDLSGDGLVDVVLNRREWYVRPPNGGTYSRTVLEGYLGDGHGSFSGPIRTVYAAPDNQFFGPYYVGDLNGDGRTDLISWSEYTSTLNILLADGTGGFQAPMPLSAPKSPADLLPDSFPPGVRHLTPGDLNGDGRLDLLARFYYSAIDPEYPRWGEPREFSALYFGDGTGHFSAPVRLVEPVEHQRTVVSQAIGDIDGDGRDDIVLSGPNQFHNPGPLYGLQPATDVYLSIGDGLFNGPILSPKMGGNFGYGARTQSPLRDLNGDGLLDLVAMGDVGGLQIAFGDGKGTFGHETYAGGFDSYWVPGAATGDFNGDGNPDIAVANSGSFTVSVWLGDGAGGWSGPQSYAVGDRQRPMAIIAADLNADGKLDLATAATYFRDGVPGVSILYGDGAGHFALGRQLDPGLATALVAADFDQDGTIDLAVGDRYDRIVELFFDMPGATRETSVQDDFELPEGSEYTLPGLAVADFDGNGMPDLVRSSETGVASVFLNVGVVNAGDYNLLRTVRVEMAARIDNVAAGDLNGDGIADLAAPHWIDELNGGAIAVALGDGKGGFGAPQDYPLYGDDMPFNIAIADLDGHGERAVVTNTGHGLKVLLADATGALGTPFTFTHDGRVGPLLHSLPLTDLNHDGLLDAVLSDAVFWNLGACGNGRIDKNEECDDGNTTSCDGCSASCKREIGALCGDGIVNAACGEECDDGAANSNAPDACRPTCRLARCGDGVQDTAEQCDDGNTVSCDGCSASCGIDPAPVCGDGVVNGACGEQCDDGNRVPGDGCSSACQLELIPGGGPGSTDCLTEWVVANPHNSPLYDRRGRFSAKQICRDNDPACDFDGGVAGSCTFHVALCVNITDVDLPRCTPAALSRCDVMRPSAKEAARSGAAADLRARFAATMQTMMAESYSECSPTMDVTVPVAGFRPGRRTLKTRAVATTHKRDIDTLKFICTP